MAPQRRTKKRPAVSIEIEDQEQEVIKKKLVPYLRLPQVYLTSAVTGQQCPRALLVPIHRVALLAMSVENKCRLGGLALFQEFGHRQRVVHSAKGARQVPDVDDTVLGPRGSQAGSAVLRAAYTVHNAVVAKCGDLNFRLCVEIFRFRIGVRLRVTALLLF